MRPASTSLCTSGASDSATTSASKPPATARDWAPDPRYDSWNTTFWPFFSIQCFWNAGMIALPYASRGVV
jgi:hypothetical protein